MENLYNSASFSCYEYNHEKKVMCKGVMRKGMDGITPSILKEVGVRNDQIYICGTVKGVRRGYYLY